MLERPQFTLFLLCFDQLSVRRLGCYGSTPSLTPTLDAFAARGIVWDQCVVSRVAETEESRPESLSALAGTARGGFTWHRPGGQAESVDAVCREFLEEVAQRSGLGPDALGLNDAHDLDMPPERPPVDEDCLVVITAACGVASSAAPHRAPLPRLRSELVTVPLIVWDSRLAQGALSRGRIVSERRSGLCDWSRLLGQLAASTESQWNRTDERIVIAGSTGETAIRTEDWHLVCCQVADDDDRVWLFRKPDDVWDLWDVSQQYPHEVERLLATDPSRRA